MEPDKLDREYLNWALIFIIIVGIFFTVMVVRARAHAKKKRDEGGEQ